MVRGKDGQRIFKIGNDEGISLWKSWKKIKKDFKYFIYNNDGNLNRCASTPYK